MADIHFAGLPNFFDWGNESITAKPAVVWTSTTTAYVFYADKGSAEGMYYVKTTDSGENWGTPVLIITNANLDDAFELAVWYDRWTPDDTGTIIHCAFFYGRSNSANSSADYRSLDTSDDSLGTQVGMFSIGSVLGSRLLGITKAKDGSLYTFGGVGSGTDTFRKSTDSGATWGSDLTDPFVINSTSTAFMMVPAPWSADDADIAVIYITTTDDTWRLAEYDDSAGTWSETDLFTLSGGSGDGEHLGGPSVTIRHSDQHVIAALVDFRSSATTDLRVFDINGSGGGDITELTQVISDTADIAGVTILAAPNDDLYVAYMKPITVPTDMPVFYKRSTDGGTTWGSETVYSETTNDYVNTDGPVSMEGGGQWAPILFEHTGSTRQRWIQAGSGSNAVEITAAAATDAATSTVTSNPSHRPADGSTTSTITVTLLNSLSVAVVGHTVTLAQGAGSSTISAASGTSNSSGVVTFTVFSSTVETVTYTATDTTDSITITDTADVTFFDEGDGTAGPSPPALTIPAGEGGIGPSPPELVLSGAAFTSTNVIGSEESSINFIHAGINDTQGPLEISDEANEVVISSG